MGYTVEFCGITFSYLEGRLARYAKETDRREPHGAYDDYYLGDDIYIH